jgi:hypothetical protein
MLKTGEEGPNGRQSDQISCVRENFSNKGAYSSNIGKMIYGSPSRLSAVMIFRLRRFGDIKRSINLEKRYEIEHNNGNSGWPPKSWVIWM